MDIPTAVGIAQDVVTGLAAAVGASVAVLGLRAWRLQLIGRSEYELARRLLRAVYAVRDGMQAVRYPAIFGGEVVVARREAGLEGDIGLTMTDEEEIAVYQSRWNRLEKLLADLEVEVLESEVLWGQRVMEVILPIRKCKGELLAAIKQYARLKKSPAYERRMGEEKRSKMGDVLYWTSEDPAMDPFTGRIMDAVAKVEAFVRPHLKP